MRRILLRVVQVCVEELGTGEGSPLDLAALDGTWRLCYMSASDVLVLFEAAERLPLLQVSPSVPRFRLSLSYTSTNKQLQCHYFSNQLQMPVPLRYQFSHT